MLDKLASSFDSFYDHMYDDYERWLAVPAVVLLLALSFLGYTYITTGQFVSKGIEFTGGSEIKIAVSPDTTQQQIEGAFRQDFTDANVRTLTADGNQLWFLIETSRSITSPASGGEKQIGASEEAGLNQQEAENKVKEILNRNNIQHSQINLRTIGAAVSGSFLFEAQIAVLVAFLRLPDGVAGLWRAVLALADPAHVALGVLEFGEVDDLDRDPHLAGPGLPEVTVLDKLREVLPALLADLAVAFEVVSQSHL